VPTFGALGETPSRSFLSRAANVVPETLDEGDAHRRLALL